MTKVRLNKVETKKDFGAHSASKKVPKQRLKKKDLKNKDKVPA